MAKKSKIKRVKDPAIEDDVIDKSENAKDFKIHRVKVIIPGSQEPLLLQLHPSDTIHDIKQAVLERSDCYFKTCLSINNEKGVRLDDFSEISSVIYEGESLILKVVEKPYSFRDVMLHAHRFYEIVYSDTNSMAIQGQSNMSISLCSSIANLSFHEQSKLNGLTHEMPTQYMKSSGSEVSLDNFFHNTNFSENNKCIKSLRLSYNNPPQSYNKLSGDLLYMELVSLEDVFYGITSRVDGFYINKSTQKKFDNSLVNEEQKFTTLDFLAANVSTMYRKKLSSLQQTLSEKHPFEILQVYQQVYCWLGIKYVPNEDLFRSLEVFTNNSSFEESFMCQIREWNEELQTIASMPITNDLEKLAHDRFIYKIYMDMTTAARKGAIAVVDGRAAPINEAEDERLRMYLWNNMFICITCDSRDHYKDFGGELAGHVAANQDLLGIQLLLSFDIKDLHLLGTTLVDYCGYRLVIQTVLPGIFHRNSGKTVDYGSVDHGKTVFVDDSFVSLAKEVAEKLHIVPQNILDEKNKEHQLYLSVEAKGIIGTDGRKYFLDLYRLLPPDPSFLPSDLKFMKLDNSSEQITFEQSRDIALKRGFTFPQHYGHKLAAFRPEFYHYVIFEHKLYQAQLADNKKEDSSGYTDDPPITSDDVVSSLKDQVKTNSDSTNNTTSQLLSSFEPKINTDCFDTKLKRPESEESNLRESRNCMRKMASFMVGEHIIAFIDATINGRIDVLIDGLSLTQSLHSKGINIRYLGYIACLASNDFKLTLLKNLCIMEMVTRVAKRMFRHIIRQAERVNFPTAISHFLNCFLGSNINQKLIVKNDPTKSKKAKSSKASIYSYRISWKKLTPASFWSTLLEDIKTSFGYKPQFNNIEELCANCVLSRLPYLRSFCLKTGVQIMCRDYDFYTKKTNTFLPEDILNIFPIVKSIEPPVPADIKRKLQITKTLIFNSEGVYYADLQEELHYMISYLNQILGPLTPEIALCYSYIAKLYSVVNNYKQATVYQFKSTTLYERLFGIDHYHTILSYYNLALYSKNEGDVHSSIQLFYRTRYLLLLSYGPDHPLIPDIEKHLTHLLAECKEFSTSLEMTDSILAYLKKNEPDNHSSVADLHQFMAAIHFSSSNFRNAVAEGRKAYSIYKQAGESEDSLRLKSCEELLKEYVKAAVGHGKEITNNYKKVDASEKLKH